MGFNPFREHEKSVLTTHLVGRKGRDYFKKRGYRITGEYLDLFRDLRYDDAARIVDRTDVNYLACASKPAGAAT